MPQILTKVHGGVINDQMLQGSVSYYQIVGPTDAFKYTISDGTVIMLDYLSNGTATLDDRYIIGDDKPVPRSAAEKVFQIITGRSTLVQISLIDNETIQFALENSNNGWDTVGDMQTAVRALGTVTVPGPTVSGVAVALGGVTITSKAFELV